MPLQKQWNKIQVCCEQERWERARGAGAAAMRWLSSSEAHSELVGGSCLQGVPSLLPLTQAGHRRGAASGAIKGLQLG